MTKRQAGHRDIKDNRETSKESEQDVQIWQRERERERERERRTDRQKQRYQERRVKSRDQSKALPFQENCGTDSLNSK